MFRSPFQPEFGRNGREQIVDGADADFAQHLLAVS